MPRLPTRSAASAKSYAGSSCELVRIPRKLIRADGGNLAWDDQSANIGSRCRYPPRLSELAGCPHRSCRVGSAVRGPLDAIPFQPALHCLALPVQSIGDHVAPVSRHRSNCWRRTAPSASSLRPLKRR